MPGELERKAKVIADLFEKGAVEVEITGTDIRVTKAEYFALVREPIHSTPPSVNVSVTTNVNTLVEATLERALHALSNRDDTDELRKQIDALKSELAKHKPNKDRLAEIMKWSLDKGFDVFLKLVPAILQKLGL